MFQFFEKTCESGPDSSATASIRPLELKDELEYSYMIE